MLKFISTIILIFISGYVFSQTWHSQKDYRSEFEDNGSLGTIGKVGIGFHNFENLRYPEANVSIHPEIPYLPQKSLHILGYEDPEYGEFIAPIPTIRLDHRYTYESGGSSGGGSQSRSGGPDPTSYVEILTAQDVWDMENNQGYLKFKKDGNEKFQFNNSDAQFGFPLQGGEYDLNVFGELRVGLSTSNYPGNFTVTGVSNFDGQIMANNESFFTDKVIIGNPSLIHSNQANANSKLMVQGTGIFQEVVVDHVTEWNDDVFNKDYTLMDLNEVESFIHKNGHLPDVPKEEEVKKNGYDLAKMDAILLKKIEELTLHVIALKKENEELKKAINE